MNQQELQDQLMEICESGDVNALNKLLTQNVDINYKNEYGTAPIHVAAQHDHKEIVEILLKKGADINILTADDLTALHFAAQKGYISIVKLLIAYKAKINQIGRRYKRTPMHYAADQGQSEAVVLLLAAGADKNILDLHENSPFEVANKKGHKATAELLK